MNHEQKTDIGKYAVVRIGHRTGVVPITLVHAFRTDMANAACPISKGKMYDKWRSRFDNEMVEVGASIEM